MDEQEIAEAMRLMSSMSQNDITTILHTAFKSPAPPVSARAVARFISHWNSPEARLQRLQMRDPIIVDEVRPSIELFDEIHTDPKSSLKLLKGIPYKPVLKVDKKFEAQVEALVEAIEKCGIPKATGQGSVGGAFKSASTRYAVRTATTTGAWQSAALTGIFNVKLLFDGDFKQYLVKVGVSGLYGGTVGGLSSWISHPFLSNGMVLGVIVGSAFGTFSLISTGDWARFQKNLGVSAIGGAASWCGAVMGGTIGSLGGPIGTAIGTAAGGVLGGLAGRRMSLGIPGLGGMTGCEIETMYKGIKEQLSTAGLEPDPSLSPLDVVTAVLGQNTDRSGPPFPVRLTGSMTAGVAQLHEALRIMRNTSPEAFGEFLGFLQAAGKK